MKALFVPFAPSLGHVGRCLAVAEAWRAGGHTATFAVGPERADLVRAAGFDTYPLPEVPGAVFRTGGLSWMSPAYFADNLAAEQEILAEVAPDVVVFDFRFTTALAARLAGRPSASILHGSALRFAFAPSRETGRLLLGDGRMSPGSFAMRWLFPLVFEIIMRMVVRRWAVPLKAHGRWPAASPYELLLGDEILAADLPDLLPPSLPPRTHVVGPLTWTGWEGPAPWLDGLDGGRPLIYVTMGSTVEAQTALAKIIRALGDGAYNVVVSTGSLALPGDLDLPSTVCLHPTVPGTTVARHSAAVVHLGGHETLMQALAAGVPSLMLPVNPDQILVAQQAQALDMGYNMFRLKGLPVDAGWQRALTPSGIRSALDRLLADRRYAEACRVFQRQMDACRAAPSAAEILEEIVRARSA